MRYLRRLTLLITTGHMTVEEARLLVLTKAAVKRKRRRWKPYEERFDAWLAGGK